MFLHKLGKYTWTYKIMKNITKSLAELLKNSELDNQNIHQSILKLARICSAVEETEKSSMEDQNVWLHFIELIISTLCLGEQQHYYNLGEFLFYMILYNICKPV